MHTTHDLRILGIHHVGVVVTDIEDGCRLFGQSFDLPELRRIERDDLRAVFFGCDNTTLELIEVLDPIARAERLGNRTAIIEHVAFSVGDLDVTLIALEALGIRLKAPPTTSLGHRTAFTDAATTSGLVFQFVEIGAAPA